jgi:hypothetical protein
LWNIQFKNIFTNINISSERFILFGDMNLRTSENPNLTLDELQRRCIDNHLCDDFNLQYIRLFKKSNVIENTLLLSNIDNGQPNIEDKLVLNTHFVIFVEFFMNKLLLRPLQKTQIPAISKLPVSPARPVSKAALPVSKAALPVSPALSVSSQTPAETALKFASTSSYNIPLLPITSPENVPIPIKSQSPQGYPFMMPSQYGPPPSMMPSQYGPPPYIMPPYMSQHMSQHMPPPYIMPPYMSQHMPPHMPPHIESSYLEPSPHSQQYIPSPHPQQYMSHPHQQQYMLPQHQQQYMLHPHPQQYMSPPHPQQYMSHPYPHPYPQQMQYYTLNKFPN